MNKLFLIAALALFFTVSFAAIDNCVTVDDNDTADDLDDDTCTLCDTGYGTNAGATACVACTDTNCATCNGAPATCGICQEGFGKLNGGANADCTACSDSGCAACFADNTKCDLCKVGFAKQDKEVDAARPCTACANNCVACATVTASCAACPTNFTKNDTNKSNVFCCKSVNCTGCSTPNNCTSCVDGVKLDEEKGTCFGFKTGASLTLGAIVSVALFSLLF